METNLKPETKNTYNNAALNIRMTKELKDSIEFFAAKEELTTSKFIRDIISNEIDKRKQTLNT